MIIVFYVIVGKGNQFGYVNPEISANIFVNGKPLDETKDYEFGSVINFNLAITASYDSQLLQVTLANCTTKS